MVDRSASRLRGYVGVVSRFSYHICSISLVKPENIFLWKKNLYPSTNLNPRICGILFLEWVEGKKYLLSNPVFGRFSRIRLTRYQIKRSFLAVSPKKRNVIFFTPLAFSNARFPLSQYYHKFSPLLADEQFKEDPDAPLLMTNENFNTVKLRNNGCQGTKCYGFLLLPI